MTDEALMKLTKAEIIKLLRDEEALHRETKEKLRNSESGAAKLAERLVLRNILVSAGLVVKKELLNHNAPAEQLRRPMNAVYNDCINGRQRAEWLQKYFD